MADKIQEPPAVDRVERQLPLEPDIPILEETEETSEADFDVDIEHLRDHLGIDNIQRTLHTLTEKITSLGNANSNPTVPESGQGSSSTDASEFDPCLGLSQTTGTPENSEATAADFLPSIFEETETFGPDVSEVIAQRVNDAVSKKPLEAKFKELQDQYKTPKNCHLLCVPKVNLELWHDLARHSKTKDLGLQEIQKNLVKSAQPMIKILDAVLKCQTEKKPIEACDILTPIADAVTFLGHASYLTSLKRREFLKPDITQPYQSVCSKSNPVSTFLFGDELPKQVKEIGEVNKIAKKTMHRPNTASTFKRQSDYKSGSGHNRYNQRGGRRYFLGYRNQKGPYYSERRSSTNPSSSTKTYKDTKEKS